MRSGRFWQCRSRKYEKVHRRQGKIDQAQGSACSPFFCLGLEGPLDPRPWFCAKKLRRAHQPSPLQLIFHKSHTSAFVVPFPSLPHLYRIAPFPTSLFLESVCAMSRGKSSYVVRVKHSERLWFDHCSELVKLVTSSPVSSISHG